MKPIFIDTHCHLNFKRFDKTREQVIKESQENGIEIYIVPGTDITSSQKAVEIAAQNTAVYAAVGFHPHHTFSVNRVTGNVQNDMHELEKLIVHPKVVAVGEVGLDKHVYEETKYNDYQISDAFIDVQKEYFVAQIRLAKKYQKALIIHNRETKKELLEVLDKEWSHNLSFHTVFHCCEPDNELLEYAKKHNMYIGVDGDVTYGGEKAEFVKTIPLEMLVLETDSPFLLPDPLRAQKLYPNTPANIPLIAECIAKIKGVLQEKVAEVTTQNAQRLFGL